MVVTAYNYSSSLSSFDDDLVDWTGSILQFKMFNRQLAAIRHQQQQQQNFINLVANPFNLLTNQETAAATTSSPATTGDEQQQIISPSSPFEYPMDPAYIAAIHCFCCFSGMIFNLIVSIAIVSSSVILSIILLNCNN